VRTPALVALVFAIATACASAPPPPPADPEPAEPVGLRLDGQVLYPSDLAAAPDAVAQGWRAYEEAWAASPPVPPEDAPVAEYRTFVEENFAEFTDGQLAAVGQLVAAYEATEVPAETLVFSVLAARLLHRASSWMWTLPVPAGPGVNPRASRALQTTMRTGAQRLAVLATDAYGKCRAAADSMGDGRAAWRQDCDARAQTLEEIRAAELTPPAPPPTPMPSSCVHHFDPPVSAPGHRARATPRLLVLVEDMPEGVDVAAVRTRIEERAQRDHSLRPVPTRTRERAEALVASGRTRAGGPVCAAPPTLPWILGAGQNLVVATVRHECGEVLNQGQQPTGERSCHLSLLWSRAGSKDREGLPDDRHRIDLPAEADTAAVVAALESEPVGGGLFGMGGMVRVSVAEVEGNPGYGLGRAIEGLDLRSCRAEPGVSELRARWSVTPTGALDEVVVEGGDEAVNACVKAKLEALRLPCPPGGAQAMSTAICIAN